MGFFNKPGGMMNSCECDNSVIESIISKLGSLETSVAQVQSKQETQQNGLSTLSASLDSFKSDTQQKVSTIDSEVTQLKTKDNSLQSEVNTLKQTSVKARVVGQ